MVNQDEVLRVMQTVMQTNHPDATVHDDVTTGDCDYSVGMMGPDVASVSGIGGNEVTDEDVSDIKQRLESELGVDVEVDTSFGTQFILDD